MRIEGWEGVTSLGLGYTKAVYASSYNMVIVCLLVLVTVAASNGLSASTRILMEWDFGSPSSAAAWSRNASVTALAVEGGCLTGRTTGHDPAITSPVFEIRASPHQYVEIRVRTSESGHGQLFWTNTLEEPYGGFRPDKCNRFACKGGEFQTYRLFPFWQEEEKIIHLRLDPPDDAEFAVDYIKIIEIASPTSNAALFDFTKPEQVWMSADDPQPEASSAGISVRRPGEAFLVSPKLDVDSQSFPWLTAMIRSDGVDHAVLQWVSDGLPGARSHTMSLKADNRWHVYNVPTEQLTDWLGRIQALATRLVLAQGQHAEIQFAGASETPMGPAELEVRNFGLKESINRAGSRSPGVVEALVTNVGGEAAQHIRACLDPGAGLSVSDGFVRSVARLGCGEQKLLTWRVLARRPGDYNAQLDIAAHDSSVTTARATLRWDPPVRVKPSGYVPKPRPVRGEYEVGAYYFPGWHTHSRWSVLDDFPERHPVLGYYREGDPEVADWHIKWMVEHGITFIVYDWYWSAGARQLEHALHRGYSNAKYRERIKFCLLWANHNAPNTSSAEDMVNVTNYWLDNYFVRPEYFKIDGRPVVIIFSPHRLTEDLGVDGVKAALDKSGEMARARGLEGICFVACTYPGKGHIEVLEREGYDALTGYNYPSAGDKGRIRAPYEDMVIGYQEFWNSIADSTKLRYIPVTEPGWDSRPWHGPNARVRTGKTPAKFKRMLENAKLFVEQRTPEAEPKIVLIEAWNEFGEGDYIEPHKEFGFEYLDVIREVFTSASVKHSDIAPQDVSLGPYGLEKPKPVTAWEFDDPAHPGWDASQNLTDARVENGCLVAVSSGHDPAFYSEAVNIDAKVFGLAEVRMRVDKGAIAQLFWAPRRGRFAEICSLKFELLADAKFRVYELDLASLPAWRSRIAALRLDPTDARDVQVEIDYIRFPRPDSR